MACLHPASWSGGKGCSYPLVKPEELAGTYDGNGCMCSPAGLTGGIIKPACGGGICVEPKMCGMQCPYPCCAFWMGPCGPCYYGNNQAWITPDASTILVLDGCGAGFVKKGGVPSGTEMAGAPPKGKEKES